MNKNCPGCWPVTIQPITRITKHAHIQDVSQEVAELGDNPEDLDAALNKAMRHAD